MEEQFIMEPGEIARVAREGHQTDEWILNFRVLPVHIYRLLNIFVVARKGPPFGGVPRWSVDRPQDHILGVVVLLNTEQHGQGTVVLVCVERTVQCHHLVQISTLVIPLALAQVDFVVHRDLQTGVIFAQFLHDKLLQALILIATERPHLVETDLVDAIIPAFRTRVLVLKELDSLIDLLVKLLMLLLHILILNVLRLLGFSMTDHFHLNHLLLTGFFAADTGGVKHSENVGKYQLVAGEAVRRYRTVVKAADEE